MLVVTHRPSLIGWEFESQRRPDVQGFGRTLTESVACADHAARHYLSSRAGYAISPDDARRQVKHLVAEEAAHSGVTVPAAAH